MTKADVASDLMIETVLTLQISVDASRSTPGVRVYASIPGRKGLLKYHWPTVQHKLTPSQVSDLIVSLGELVSGRLWDAGVSRWFDPDE